MSRIARAKQVFIDALERPESERAAFVDRECAGDAALHAEVHALLAVLAEGGEFLSSPTGHDAAPTADHDPAASKGSPLSAASAARVREGQEQEAALRERPGTRIGPYKVLEEIGEGGFGSVFLAEQEKPVRRRVALKIIKLGMDTRQVVARFEQERQALAMMDHPNIAKVLDAGATEAGRPYFVMELVKGRPVTAFCDEGKLSITERLELFGQVCAAVQHAHTKGIIHRDIKPSNVLVSEQDGGPFAKVIDFGIAKATASKLTEKTLFTQHSQIIGTPEYMSPEQAQGSLDIDTRTDVYSLGVLLYELLTGSTPFSGTELKSAAYDEIRRIIREVEPPKPSTRLSQNTDTIASVAAVRRSEPGKLGTTVRGDLDWIVMKALEKDRGRRYETANGLAMDVRRYLSGEAVTAAPPSAAYRLRKVVGRHRAAFAAGGAVGAALIVGVVAFAWQARAARVQRDRAIVAEAESKERADELQKVADYQAKMLQQVDVTDAGIKLMADLRARHGAALERSRVPAPERDEREAALDRELHAINSTDAAAAMLDRTVLEPAVRTIGTQFADQPLVDASLRATMGVMYYKLGRYEEALALYRRSYELRAASLGEDSPEALQSRGGVGNMLGELQRLPEAESTIRAVLDGLRRARGEDAKDTLDAMSLLATQMNLQGRYEEAEVIVRDLLERCRRTLGPDHADTLQAMDFLGRLLMSRGEYDDATRVLRDVLESQRRVADSSVSTTLGNLGIALNRQREYAAAEACLREALERRRNEKGEDHPSTLTSMANLAALLMDREKLPEAEALAKEALEKSRRVFGSEQAQTLKSMNIMGQVLYRQNRLAETEPYYREALETGRRVLGEDHPDTIVWIANLGFLYQRLGRLDEAEALSREALDKNRRQLGEAHPYTLSMVRRLADLLRQQNRPAEAEESLRRALENVRRVEGEDHLEALAFAGLLGSVLREQGRLDEAEVFFQQVLEKSRRLNGERHADTLTAVLRMAMLRVAQGKHEEALALLTPIDGKIEEVIPGTTGVLRQASLRGLMGRARLGLAATSGDYLAAEADLLAARAAFADLRGEKDKETREWTVALADLHDAWERVEPGAGHDGKAAEWRSKMNAGGVPGGSAR